ncbi:CDP-glycerol glycerophosphotransferase family protein [Streptomyces sp. NPDC021093]|uniref:bifunctional glycosyltransferase/CDP-glycerol:glycerophosphate glycerophosphotransferase n=1 Tax=Streptomyces sp. NPDC021093 TaxID=3365112 RepID=UPI003793E6E0
MPRFSVIVPAYQVQEYLEECLDSVLTQSFDDLELIAVDDCSPDACGDLIDEYAARDPRVRPVHLTENGGLGNARNMGLELARGDYLLFLDSDDTLTPGALQSISDRLKESDSPDVLVFDYARTFWTGEAERNQFRAELHEQGPASFALADRPGLLRVLMVAWNKAYSREFIERQDFAFPSGYYEDTPWTYPVLMSASSISTLDEVCVHYRQRRQGNILSTTSRKHFDLFDQYDRVFAFLDARPELAGWRPVIYRRMIDHFGTVFTRPGRLPKGCRAEFFRRARAHCRKYRTPDAALSRTPARPRGIAARSAAARNAAARAAATAVAKAAVTDETASSTSSPTPATTTGVAQGGPGRPQGTSATDGSAARDTPARGGATDATATTATTATDNAAAGPGATTAFGTAAGAAATTADSTAAGAAARTTPGTAAEDNDALRIAAAGPVVTVGFGAVGTPAAPRIAAPSPRTRLRQALVRLGSHRTYRTLALAQAVRRTVTGRTRAVLRITRSAAMQLHYRIQLRLPVRDNQAVFAAYWGRGYSCNPAALEAKVRELAPHIRTLWLTTPTHAHTVPTGTRRLRPGSAAYWSALARAKYLVNNVNFDHRLAKRPGQVLLQTQHGTPLKSMGLDLQDRPAADMDFEKLLANTDKWDYLLSSNRHSSLVWGKAYPSAYTTLEHGYPRNDVFQTATAGDVARIRESLNIPEGTTAVLYAPTHRDYRRTQRLTLDLERIARSLGPRHVILTRAHYFTNGPLHHASSHSSARIVDVSEHHSIESLCLASDALVTDYSSLMFDYANLDRPIVLHIDDWEAYEAARGTYFDIREFPPGAIARNDDELIDIFRTGHWRGSRSAQLRAAFRARFCPYDDGFAAERVVRRVFLGQTEGLPRFVPLEDRAPAPASGSTAATSVLPAQQDAQTTAHAPAQTPAQATAQATAQAVSDLLPAELR